MTICLVMEFENVYYPNTYLPAKFLTSTPSLDIKKASKKFARKNPWGNRSYADLIAQAISSSPEQRLTLSQIYEWMTKNIPFFQNQLDSSSSAGWKNSIRHNLSLHKKFRRIRNDATGKSSWWTVNPEVGTVRSPRRKGSSRRKRTKGMENMSLFKNHHSCKLPNFPIWSTPSSNVSPPHKGSMEIFDLPLTEGNHSMFSPTQVYQESQTSFRGCLQEQYRQDSKTMTDYFMSPHHMSGSYITIGEDKERSNFCHEIETDVGILSVFAHGKDEKGSEENAVRENDSEDDVIDLLLKTDIADIERLDMVLKEIRSIQNEYEIATNQNLQDSNSNVSDDVVASSMLDSDNQPTVDESDVHQLSSCSTSNLLPNASLLPTTNISQKNLSENFALQPLMAMERPVSYSEPILFIENFCMSDSNQKLKEKNLRKKKLSLADNSIGQLYHSKSWQNESENKYNSEESNKIASFQNTFYSNYQFSDTAYRTSVNLTNFNETLTKRLVNNTTYRKTVSQNISQIYEQNITQATYPNSIPTPDHILGISKHELSQTSINEKERRYFPFLFEYNSNLHKIYPNSDLNFLNNSNISEERVNTCIYKQEIEQVAQSNTFLDAEACTLPTSRKDCCYNLPETLNIADSAHPDSSSMETTIQKDVLVELNDCEIKSENDDCSMKENLELSPKNINKVSGIDTQYVEGDDQNKCLLNYNQNTELLSFSNPFLPALTIQEKRALADPHTPNFSSAFELHLPSQLSSIDDAIEELLNMNSSYAKDSIESAVLEMAKELLGKDMSSSLEGKSEDTNICIDEDTDIYLWNEALGSDSITIQENSHGSVTNKDCKDEKFAAKCDFTKNIFQGSNQNIS